MKSNILFCIKRSKFSPKLLVTKQISAFIFKMTDSEKSSKDVFADAREGSSQEYKMDFSEDEKTLIARMFNLIGQRWSLIAGRIPGRTAEEIEKYWTSRYYNSEEQ